MDNEGEFGLEDDERARRIAAKILASGADIVALNEVFPDDARDALVAALEPSYPHLVAEVGDNDLLAQDSGLMLFSRHPFLRLPSNPYPPSSLTARSAGAPFEDVAFLEFDAQDFDESLTLSVAGDTSASDSLADKGVAVVLVDTPLGEIPVAFTHLWASYSVQSTASLIWRARARRQQLERAIQALLATVGESRARRALILGDINVDGNWTRESLPWPLESSALLPMLGSTPAAIGSGQIADMQAFQQALSAGVQALIAADPSLLVTLYELATQAAQGTLPVGPLQVTHPPDAPPASVRRNRLEWETSILGAPVGGLLEDGWSALYRGAAPGGQEDLGCTNGEERLDYVLAPHPAARRWAVQHMTLAYNLRDGASGMSTEWGPIGVNPLSDHMGVNAYLAIVGRCCRPSIAEPVARIPSAVPYSIEHPGALFWYRLELRGTAWLGLPPGVAGALYRSSQMSVPARWDRERVHGAQHGEAIADRRYQVDPGVYFLRVSLPEGETGNGFLEAREPKGLTADDAIPLSPEELHAQQMTPNLPYGDKDELWFEIDTEPADSGERQRLRVELRRAPGGAAVRGRFQGRLVAADGTRLARLQPAPDGRGLVAEIQHDASAHPAVFLVIRRKKASAERFAVRWSSDLRVLGGTLAEPLRLACAQTTPGMGDDEILLRVVADGRAVTAGSGGWLYVGDFEEGGVPRSIGGQSLPSGRPVIRFVRELKLDLLESDDRDVIGANPEVFRTQWLRGDALQAGQRRQAAEVTFRRDGDGVYTLSGFLARRSIDLV